MQGGDQHPVVQQLRREDSGLRTRTYSTKDEPVSIFADILRHIGRRGYYRAGSGKEGTSFLYAAFHLHPDDADNACALIERAMATYGGGTQWILKRPQQNRFFICAAELMSETGKPGGNPASAALELSKTRPGLESDFARDMVLLCDRLYEVYFERRFGPTK
jgi:hypothetical protein